MGNKLTFCKTIEETKKSRFDTIICLDVLEHLSDPAFYLDTFHEIMGPNSIGLFNWYFYKGENNEYPFHIDDEEIIEQFFKTLQSKFVEVFHPILITTRSYKKNLRTTFTLFLFLKFLLILSKITVPSFKAKSVSSLPLPTLIPGKKEVPLWRIMIDPADTFSPP